MAGAGRSDCARMEHSRPRLCGAGAARRRSNRSRPGAGVLHNARAWALYTDAHGACYTDAMEPPAPIG